MGNRQIPFKIKTIPCEVDGYREERYPSPHANIQVKLTEHCNADCAFCTYHNNRSETKFNMREFIRGLIHINKYVEIPCVTFTGGETTLEIDTIIECINVIRIVSPNTRIKIHTNGLYLQDLLEIDGVWRISLSRHGIFDKENYSIFRTSSVPTLQQLKNIDEREKNRIHIDCNMIKGHVDNVKKLRLFLNTLLDVGITDFGFVTLMPVNKYCEEHFVDSTKVLADAKLTVVKHCRYIKEDNKPHCECCNYEYTSPFGQIATLYSRRAIDMNCEEASLVFNSQSWKQGFSGSKLEYY